MQRQAYGYRDMDFFKLKIWLGKPLRRLRSR
jgi:hypothetical protein